MSPIKTSFGPRSASAWVVLIMLILYLEPLEIGGIKLGYIWKPIAVAVLFTGVVIRKTMSLPRWTPAFIAALNSLFVLAITPLLSMFVQDDVLGALVLSSQRLFPLIILLGVSLVGVRPERLGELVAATPIVLALGALPFVAGVITPTGQAYKYAEAYGLVEPGFVGVFQNPHAAALALALAAIVAFTGGFYAVAWPRVIYFASGTGLSYLVLMTYARTGLLVLAGGLVAIALSLRGRAVVFAVAALATLGGAVGAMSAANAGLRSRLMGQTAYSYSGDVVIEHLTSGRTRFWTATVDAYIDGGPLVWFVGLGETGLRAEMVRRVGADVFAHNGFLNTLASNGIVGLGAQLLFLYWSFRVVLAAANIRLRSLGSATLAGWVGFLAVQGGEMPLQMLLVLVCISIAAIQRSRRFSAHRAFAIPARYVKENATIS